MNNKKMPVLKPIVSVTEMAKMLDLSRARFYQLLNDKIFPQPIYDLRTHRPMYDAKLQERCLEIRNSGIGDNGHYILFYSPRKKDAQTRTSKKTTKSDLLHKEFAETLASMGLNCSVKNISLAIAELYPDGIEELDHGVVIRDLFRFLESK
ncbi:MAG: hypothetical protein JEZ01_20915 [Labilibaculum sp.]|nr:hypothetical protein [Labilibaculum sp.]MBI9060242.1 hypothetical protein [Labilibaculum sp.]